MQSVTLKCRTITPMFMYGADGKTPELRPSEFKGMMRFWWRAIKAEDDIEKLRREEAELFGGTGKVERKSRVRIRVYPNLIEPRFIGKDVRNEFKKEKSGIDGNPEGLYYLLYSTFTLKVKGERLIRKFIEPQFKFEMNISSIKEEDLKKSLSALWLSIFLGGFGTRARRGGGNIEVFSTEGKTYKLQFTPVASNKNELKKWLEDNLKKIKDILHTADSTQKYSNLSGGRILVFDPRPTWQKALDFIGLEFKAFRNNQKNKIQIWDISAFGMPVMHNKFSIRMVPYKDGERLSDRLSSPVIIKTIKARDKENNDLYLYYPIIVKLNYKVGLVGKEQKVNKKWELAMENDIKPASNTKVDKFLDEMKKNNGVEVSL